MEKQTPQEERQSAEISRKDNLKSASLWGKINARIANKVRRATNGGMAKPPAHGQTQAQYSSDRIIHPYKLRKLAGAHY